MRRLRHTLFVRVLTFSLLLWVGFDVGAHGLLASDFDPIAVSGSAARISNGDAPTTPHVTLHDCFCHGISIGAVMPELPVALAPSGAAPIVGFSQVPRGDRNPVDHPPQLLA